jgi:hypothetical protein
VPSLVIYALLLLFKKPKEEIDQQYSWTLKTDSGVIEIYNPFKRIGIFAGAGGRSEFKELTKLTRSYFDKDY